MKYLVTLERDEGGFIVPQCPSLPGCLSQGKTRDEALANIRDAIEGYLQSVRKHGEPLPATEVTEVEVKVA